MRDGTLEASPGSFSEFRSIWKVRPLSSAGVWKRLREGESVPIGKPAVLALSAQLWTQIVQKDKTPKLAVRHSHFSSA